jgi:hypothetical protein
MNRNPSKEESKAMLKWLNQNRQQLRQYAHQYVAYNANGIITHGENLQEVLRVAEESGEIFSIYLVPGFSSEMPFISGYFRTFR